MLFLSTEAVRPCNQKTITHQKGVFTTLPAILEKATLSRLETNLNEAQIRYTEIFNNLNSLQIDQAKETSNLIQIEDAKSNHSPIRPRTRTNVMLAAVVGGMIALGIIFLIEYLDDTIKTPEQVLEDTELTTLGAIATIKYDP